MTLADLVEALRAVPSQVFADLTLGLPLALFVVLLFLAHGGRGRRLR